MLALQANQEELYEHLRVDQGISEVWATSLIRRKDKFLRWLKKNGKPTNPAEIRKLHIREYFDMMKTELAPQTVRKRLTALRKWFRFHDEDKMDQMRFSLPKQGRVERPYYTPEEANRVWKTAEKMGKQELALVSVNLGMGLRNIEAWRLKWRHIDLKERVMEITGKNKERENVIPKRVNENLREWKEEQTNRFGKCEYVFVKEVVRNKGAESGDHVKRPDTLTDWLNKILDKAEVDTRDGFRAGRRRFGRDLYKATGYEIRSVSQYFGHSDPRETLKYLQLDEFDQREKIDQLDEMLENLHYPERKEKIVKTPVKMKAGPEEEKRVGALQANQSL